MIRPRGFYWCFLHPCKQPLSVDDGLRQWGETAEMVIRELIYLARMTKSKFFTPFFCTPRHVKNAEPVKNGKQMIKGGETVKLPSLSLPFALNAMVYVPSL